MNKMAWLPNFHMSAICRIQDGLIANSRQQQITSNTLPGVTLANVTFGIWEHGNITIKIVKTFTGKIGHFLQLVWFTFFWQVFYHIFLRMTTTFEIIKYLSYKSLELFNVLVHNVHVEFLVTPVLPEQHLHCLVHNCDADSGTDLIFVLQNGLVSYIGADSGTHVSVPRTGLVSDSGAVSGTYIPSDSILGHWLEHPPWPQHLSH